MFRSLLAVFIVANVECQVISDRNGRPFIIYKGSPALPEILPAEQTQTRQYVVAADRRSRTFANNQYITRNKEDYLVPDEQEEAKRYLKQLQYARGRYLIQKPGVEQYLKEVNPTTRTKFHSRPFKIDYTRLRQPTTSYDLDTPDHANRDILLAQSSVRYTGQNINDAYSSPRYNDNEADEEKRFKVLKYPSAAGTIDLPRTKNVVQSYAPGRQPAELKFSNYIDHAARGHPQTHFSPSDVTPEYRNLVQNINYYTHLQQQQQQQQRQHRENFNADESNVRHQFGAFPPSLHAVGASYRISEDNFSKEKFVRQPKQIYRDEKRENTEEAPQNSYVYPNENVWIQPAVVRHLKTTQNVKPVHTISANFPEHEQKSFAPEGEFGEAEQKYQYALSGKIANNRAKTSYSNYREPAESDIRFHSNPKQEETKYYPQYLRWAEHGVAPQKRQRYHT